MSERDQRGLGSGGAGPCSCGANSAGLRCEARFELLSSAWLRSLFCVRWALLRSTEPGYQTPKTEKRWDEVRISELPQATKHTLRGSCGPFMHDKGWDKCFVPPC
jgi:hypothetical protein